MRNELEETMVVRQFSEVLLFEISIGEVDKSKFR